MTDASTLRIGWLPAVEVHAGRLLRRWVRSPAALVYTVGVPIIMVVIIRLMFSGMVKQFSGMPMDMVDVAVMIAVSQAFTGGLFGAGSIVQERHDGLPQRLATLPGSRSTAVVGRILAESIRAFVSIVIAILISVIYGADFGGVLNAIEILLFFLLVAVSAGAFGVMLGYVVNTPQGAFSVTPLIMAFTMFNTAMMPRDMYLPSLRRLVDVSPVTAVTRLVDSIIAAQPGMWTILSFLGWFGGLLVLSLLVLARRLNKYQR